MGALEKVELAVGEGSKRDFYYRPESVGDKAVIQQIFQNHDYELGHFRLTDRLMKLGETESRRGRELLIIDAGANIGAAALYFSFRFSGSKVIAIEPEKKNCELLRMNCAGLNIAIVEAALGCEAGKSFLSDPGLSDWGFRTGDTGDYEVDVVTVNQLFDFLYCGENLFCFNNALLKKYA